MKKIILVLSMLTFSISIFSQETEFKFQKDGFTDFIVTNCDGKTQSELFKKTLDWVLLTYKNPKEVIKAQIENEYIRIEGSSSNLVCFNAMGKSCDLARYTIEISFKDGKYKFDVIKNIEYLYQSGWVEIRLDKTELYYNNKGEIRNNYKYFPEIAEYFNNLNRELKDFIMKGNQPNNKDW
jgi:hypothetical protein